MLRNALLVSIFGLSSIASAQSPNPSGPPSSTPPSLPADVPAAAPAPIVASTPTPAVEPAPSKMLGIGYKIGNGIGLLGADLVINPVPHVSLDLQGAFLPITVSGASASATAWALAPGIQGDLFAGQRSTPYLSAGLQYAYLKLDTTTASATGMFANVGYEWKWRSGLGIKLGAGVQYLAKAQAMSGASSVEIGGKANPNLEFGVRYMFF